MYSSRSNFSEKAETILNEQLYQELTASLAYQSMAAWLDRDGVSLPGLLKFCRESVVEEREHAMKIQDYINRRGGKVHLKSISPPEKDGEWESPTVILETMLALEKKVNESLLLVHKTADEENDPQLADFIENEFLGEQVESIKKICDMLVQLERAGGSGLGLYLWDRDLLK